MQPKLLLLTIMLHVAVKDNYRPNLYKAFDSPELYLRKMALISGVTLGSTTDVKLWSTFHTQITHLSHHTHKQRTFNIRTFVAHFCCRSLTPQPRQN